MKQILHILILVAFLGGIIAPACGFMWGGQYSVIEICTAQGFETRIVANDKTPDEQNPTMADNCEFCFANANLISFLPSAILAETTYSQAKKLRFQQYEDVVLTRFNTNISSRGPPALI